MMTTSNPIAPYFTMRIVAAHCTDRSHVERFACRISNPVKRIAIAAARAG
jgi:hypothetical protein